MFETPHECNCTTTDTKLTSSFPQDSRIVALWTTKNFKHYVCANLWLHSFLASALDGAERSTSRPVRFTPGNNSVTYWLWSWVCLRASLEVFRENKYLLPCQNSNPFYPANSLVAMPTELSRLSFIPIQFNFYVSIDIGPPFRCHLKEAARLTAESCIISIRTMQIN